MVGSGLVIHEVVDALEGNGDGLLVDGSFELDLVSLSDVLGVSDGESEHAGLDSAVCVHSLVRIRLFAGNTTGREDVLEGVGGKTTVASVVVEGTGAVNELLFSVGSEDTRFDEVGALEAADGGECPA